MYYKYRNFSNLPYALDILIHQRLYAATFESLNDPMEGSYIYDTGLLSKGQIKSLYDEKMSYRILSLSHTMDNMLMWAYYADTDKGMVIGVDIADLDVEIEPVKYVKNLKIPRRGTNIAKQILTRKLAAWDHEEEVRVLKRHHTFVAVRVESIIFGSAVDAGIKNVVTAIADRFCPGVTISTLDRHQLKRGLKGAN